jgi:hypothetical protein
MRLFYIPISTRLLDSRFADFFTHYVKPDGLMIGVKVLAVCILIIVSVIYIYLWIKKKYYLSLKTLSLNLEAWLSEIVMEDVADVSLIPGKIRWALKSKYARQFIIDELVRFKKSISGEASARISLLYEQLQLKNDSIHKLKSARWHIRAKGIQELYIMKADDALSLIFPLTNSHNDYVRMEAQTGVVYLTGFDGLRFLDNLTLPLTEWQQIKLLEQLRQAKNKSGLAANISRWLQSDNDTVVVFALKLAGEYQVFEVIQQIKTLLDNAPEKVRREAIIVLIKFAEDDLLPFLLEILSRESIRNQLLILDALAESVNESEEGKLIGLLDHPDNLIKLHAAMSLVKCSDNGIRLIKDKALMQPEPFSRIFSHIQFALAK